MRPGQAPPWRRAAGESLHRWYSSQRFCGRCGARMEKSTDRARQVCPAVLIRSIRKSAQRSSLPIHDGDRLVLTRYNDAPSRTTRSSPASTKSASRSRTPCTAKCIEEAGLRVKNLRLLQIAALGLHRYAALGLRLPNLTAATKSPCRRIRTGRSRLASMRSELPRTSPHQPDRRND